MGRGGCREEKRDGDGQGRGGEAVHAQGQSLRTSVARTFAHSASSSSLDGPPPVFLSCIQRPPPSGAHFSLYIAATRRPLDTAVARNLDLFGS